MGAGGAIQSIHLSARLYVECLMSSLPRNLARACAQMLGREWLRSQKNVRQQTLRWIETKPLEIQ